MRWPFGLLALALVVMACAHVPPGGGDTPVGEGIASYYGAGLRGNRTASGALPLNFFSIPIPAGFTVKDANTFDVTNLTGFKLYRLRQSWGNGGGLYAPGVQRYIQFGIKIFF